jgi:hypothetical protein
VEFQRLTFTTLKRLNYITRHRHHHHRQTGPFSAIILLTRLCQTCLSRRELDYPVFPSVGFTAVMFIAQQGRQPCVQTLTLEDQVSVFMFPSDRVAQFYPPSSRHWIPYSSLSTIHRATVVVSRDTYITCHFKYLCIVVTEYHYGDRIERIRCIGLPAAVGLGVYSASNRYEYQKHKTNNVSGK